MSLDYPGTLHETVAEIVDCGVTESNAWTLIHAINDESPNQIRTDLRRATGEGPSRVMAVICYSIYAARQQREHGSLARMQEDNRRMRKEIDALKAKLTERETK